MWLPRISLFILALICCPREVFPYHWDLYHRFCGIKVIEWPLIVEEFPFPVGCEVIDCCPGCPGPGLIEWRIRIDRQILQSVELRFDGVSGTALSNLKLSGNARLEKDHIILSPGESRISGLPPGSEDRVAVGFIRPVVDRAALPADATDADADAVQPDQSGGIEIRQYLGPHIVNYSRLRVVVTPCFTPRLQDRIRLTNNRAADEAVILADYRRSGGCDNDRIHRTATQRNIGNALTNATCNSEVSVFSDDDAMSFEPNVTTWTANAGDVHTVDLSCILRVPVTIWVTAAGAAVQANIDVANANLLYNQNNAGIQFIPTVVDVSANANAVAAIGPGGRATLGGLVYCENAAGLNGTVWYTPNRLNVYYTNGVFTGVNCTDRNVNYIGTTANLGSLPHEIGHAYGLRPSGSGGHTNAVAGFGNNNIMWGGGPGTRNHFSVGQVFRINTEDGSMLNLNGDRTGSNRNCAPDDTGNLCPDLALDDLPH